MSLQSLGNKYKREDFKAMMGPLIRKAVLLADLDGLFQDIEADFEDDRGKPGDKELLKEIAAATSKASAAALVEAKKLKRYLKTI